MYYSDYNYFNIWYKEYFFLVIKKFKLSFKLRSFVGYNSRWILIIRFILHTLYINFTFFIFFDLVLGCWSKGDRFYSKSKEKKIILVIERSLFGYTKNLRYGYCVTRWRWRRSNVSWVIKNNWRINEKRIRRIRKINLKEIVT